MLKKILIANRGEIATRIARTCREMDIAIVAVYSEADRSSPHLCAADEVVCVGPALASESYLNIGAVLAAAQQTGADAIHPGYGFLSENATFARAAHAAGLTFIGPAAEALAAVGNKIFARQAVTKLGIPVIPALENPASDPTVLCEQVKSLGYPVLIKAAAGGGGKGMRIVREEAELVEAVSTAQREAQAAFAEGTVYVERFIERPHHVEVQILGDTTGSLVHLGERECSIQRRYQKIVEETPSPAVSQSLRNELTAAALTIAQAAGYYNAGTVEFILDSEGNFYFLEVNARLQVEHPITEWITGLDLVREQIRIAASESLGFSQDDVQLTGHAIECRLYAEDAAHGFLPSPGKVLVWHAPHGPGIRVDAGVESQTDVPVYYDPMMAKISAWGMDREQARRRMARALRQTTILGPTTNLPFLIELIDHPVFIAGETHTAFLPDYLPDWQPGEKPYTLAAALAAALNCSPIGGGSGGETFLPAQETETPWQQLGGWRISS